MASIGTVVLTFLAGAELDPDIIRVKLAEVTVVGMVGFLAPFLGCTAIALYGLGWNWQASALCGVALSTTSMAVVYCKIGGFYPVIGLFQRERMERW